MRMEWKIYWNENGKERDYWNRKKQLNRRWLLERTEKEYYNIYEWVKFTI